MAYLTKSRLKPGNRKFAHNRKPVDRGVVEFDLIDQYFNRPFRPLSQTRRETVLSGIGDDCATLAMLPGYHLYVSTDTMVEGVHFFSDHPAYDLGWKALACNLSDLAASGATPMGFTLSLTLPRVSDAWLSSFSQGLLALAQQSICPLVGGDTTSAGPGGTLSVSITVLGQAPSSQSGFARHCAVVDDDVWVSGLPGLARVGLMSEFASRQMWAELGATASEQQAVAKILAGLPPDLLAQAKVALQTPEPQLELSRKLVGHAHACIDLSDGLSGDLGHISKASACGIQIVQSDVDALWLSRFPALGFNGRVEPSTMAFLRHASLVGGDDYQLCWTADPRSRKAVESLLPNPARVGTVATGHGVWLLQPNSPPVNMLSLSYDHFKVTSRE